MKSKVKKSDLLPSEVTPEFLADLHDCAFKFGTDDVDHHIRRVEVREPRQVVVGTSTDPKRSVILISGPGSLLGPDGVWNASAIKKDDFIFWDRLVSVQEVKILIARVDAYFFEKGWIDGKGNRVRRAELVQSERGKFSVEEIFEVPGTTFFVPPGMDPEAMRQDFDRPQDVAIMKTPLGLFILCHVRDERRVKQRETFGLQALKEFGYKDLSELPDDPEAFSALRERIQKRVAELES